MRNYWENKLKHQNNIERKQKTATVSSVDQSQLRQLNTAPETGSESWIFSCFPPTRQHSCALAQRHYSSRKQTLLTTVTRTRASCCQVSRSTFTSNSNQLSRLKRSTKAPWQQGEKVRGVRRGGCGGGGRSVLFIRFIHFSVFWSDGNMSKCLASSLSWSVGTDCSGVPEVSVQLGSSLPPTSQVLKEELIPVTILWIFSSFFSMLNLTAQILSCWSLICCSSSVSSALRGSRVTSVALRHRQKDKTDEINELKKKQR